MCHYNPEDGGIQFDPYEDELIKRFLIPKLRGERCPSGGRIVMKDVYAKEPWLLDHTRGSFFKKNEWYYFATRTQVSEKKIGCGQKAKRRITGENNGGSWKANDTKNIIDEETEMVIGKKQTLKFTDESNKNKKMQKRGDGTSFDIIVRGSDSSWIMTEYMLPEEEDGKFQTLVLCKIHVIKKSNKKDDHHETSAYRHHDLDSSTSEKQQPPSLCGGSGPQNPHMERERNEEQSGEGNMINQIDAFSTIETVPGRSSHKDGKSEAMEVTKEVEEDCIGDHMNKYASNGTKAVLNRPERCGAVPVIRVSKFSDLGL